MSNSKLRLRPYSFLKTWAFLSAALLLGACGKTEGGSDYESVSLDDSPISLTGNSALSSSMRKTIAKDLNALSTFLVEPENENEIRNLMNISNSNGSALLRWIQERVQYISGPVNESVMDGNIRFFSIVSDLRGVQSTEAVSANVSTIAANLGSSLYMVAKDTGVRAQYDFSSSQTLDIRSPRIGLIILFDPFFNVNTFSINPSNKEAISNSMNRVSTLIHEARHSDGNNASLGFPHVDCPDSKPEYAGYAACDIAVNGAYAIEAALHKKFIAECEQRDCSNSEIAILKAYRVDYLYRLLDEDEYGTAAVNWDPTPESVN